MAPFQCELVECAVQTRGEPRLEGFAVEGFRLDGSQLSHGPPLHEEALARIERRELVVLRREREHQRRLVGMADALRCAPQLLEASLQVGISHREKPEKHAIEARQSLPSVQVLSGKSVFGLDHGIRSRAAAAPQTIAAA